MSGGLKQRLSLATALIGRPELVFVDEPTAGVDPIMRRVIWAVLAELREEGVTVVLTTHHMQEAEALADRIHILDRGRVVLSGAPADLKSASGASTTYLSVAGILPPHASRTLRAVLGPAMTVELEGHRLNAFVIAGPATPDLLARISRWCEDNALRIETLRFGPRDLDDVFLDVVRQASK